MNVGARAIFAVFASLVLLFAVDALLFRTPFYPSILDPDSTTGDFEWTLWRELKYQAERGDNLVATFGDSRFGYLPRLANRLTPETGYMFTHPGMAGTNSRIWYYMLRDLDPTASRYRAIVFGVNDYDDEDEFPDPAEDPRDVHYVAARLRLTDALTFAASFHRPESRWSAFRGTLFRGFILQRDAQEFLNNPRKRLDIVRFYRQGWPGWTYGYDEEPQSMAGLKIDWKNWRAEFSPSASPVQKSSVSGFLMHPVAPQTGRLAAFRREWFGKIIDRYRNSRTKIVFVRLARGPVVRPGWLVQKKSSSIRELACRPGVLLADEHAFESLEHPEFFKDGLHLNRDGATRFSALLAREIRRVLGPLD